MTARQTIKKGLLIVALIVLVLAAWLGIRAGNFVYQEHRLSQKVDEHLFGEAQLLVEDGATYRDLNKNGRRDVYETPAAAIEARIEDLLAQMTVEEKVGLLFHPVIAMGPGGTVAKFDGLRGLMTGDPTTSIVMRHINHFNLATSGPVIEEATWHNAIQKIAERTRLGIPVTISSDPRHSYREAGFAASIATEGFSHWPEPLGFGAIDDVTITEQFGRIANAEYRAIGIRTALHPMADLATEPRWSRIIGTFGEDADVSARQTAAYIRGFQGKGIDSQSVITMTKHFSGGGPQEDGDDAHFSYGRNQVYPGNNFDYHLKPFAAAFAAGTGQIMPYYGIPVGQTDEDVAFAFNKEIISGLLRDQYGFDGVVCADWGVITPIGAWRHYGILGSRSWGVENLSVKERFKKSVEAGIDQFGGERFPEPLIELVKSGEIAEARIDTSVRRILRDKFRLGLFDNPYVDAKTAPSKTRLPEYVEAGNHAQRIAQVLLKNQITDGNKAILPLTQGAKIYVENIDAGIAANYGTVVATPADADFAILRLKAPAREPMLRPSMVETLLESYFRQGDLDFEEAQLADIREVMAQAPTIVTIYLDRPAVIPEIAAESVGLIANFGADDDAILDVIFGRAEPKGKLPFELPSSMEAVRAQREDVPYDSEQPLYPFGYGLRYTDYAESSAIQ